MMGDEDKSKPTETTPSEGTEKTSPSAETPPSSAETSPSSPTTETAPVGAEASPSAMTETTSPPSTETTPPANAETSPATAAEPASDEHDDFFSLFSDIDLEELANETAQEQQAATAESPSESMALVSTTPIQILPQAALDLVKNRHAACAISIPGIPVRTEPMVRYASKTDWPILDYGGLMLTGPGQHAYKRDFLTEDARLTANEMVDIAINEKHAQTISIKELFPHGSVPLADMMNRQVWKTAQEHQIQVTDYKPTEGELRQLEIIDKIRGVTPTPDSQTPT